MLGSGLLAAVSLLSLGMGHAAPVAPRVLFIGNSFTFVNDLPHQLINIAQSLGQYVPTEATCRTRARKLSFCAAHVELQVLSFAL